MIGDLGRLGIRAKRSQRFTLAFVCRALCFFVFVPWMPSLKEAYVFFLKSLREAYVRMLLDA